MSEFDSSDENLFVKQDGSSCSSEILNEHKMYAIYFASSWCDDCEESHPSIKSAFEEINGSKEEEESKEEKPSIQFIFVSSDHSSEDATAYFNTHHGDWLMVPYDSPLRNDLKRKFSLEFLVIFESI